MKRRITGHLLLWLAVTAIAFGQAGCTASSQPSSNAAGGEATPANANTSGQAIASANANASEQTAPAPPAPAAAPQAAAPQAAAPEPAARPEPPRTYTLASGRAIAVFTSSTLSTKANKAGEPFTAHLANAIVDGDWVIAHKGAPVEGTIVKADPGGRVKGVASMTVKLNRLTLADGRTIPIATSAYVTQAKSTKKKDAKKIGVGAGVGAVIGAIAGGGKGAAIGAGVGGGAGTAAVLATRGDPAVIAGESQLSFRLSAPVVITKH